MDDRAVLSRLAREAGTRLLENHLLLATAESCTGGMVAAAITAIAGSSAWFDRGFVTYSNAAKTAMIGVAPALLDRYGAVSEPVAAAMAECALRHSVAQVTLSITGIAGPGGGTAAKPVGTVCFGWHRDGQTVQVTRHFDGDREAVREQAAVHALEGLLAMLATAPPASVSPASRRPA